MKVELVRKEYSNTQIFENVLRVNYAYDLVFIECGDSTKVIPTSSIITLTEYK